jgi:hypothetical protein
MTRVSYVGKDPNESKPGQLASSLLDGFAQVRGTIGAITFSAVSTGAPKRSR